MLLTSDEHLIAIGDVTNGGDIVAWKDDRSSRLIRTEGTIKRRIGIIIIVVVVVAAKRITSGASVRQDDGVVGSDGAEF